MIQTKHADCLELSIWPEKFLKWSHMRVINYNFYFTLCNLSLLDSESRDISYLWIRTSFKEFFPKIISRKIWERIYSMSFVTLKNWFEISFIFDELHSCYECQNLRDRSVVKKIQEPTHSTYRDHFVAQIFRNSKILLFLEIKSETRQCAAIYIPNIRPYWSESQSKIKPTG